MKSVATPTLVTHHAAWREVRLLLRPWRALILVIGLLVLLAEAFAVVPPLLMKRIIDDHLTVGIAEGVLALALFYLAATAMAMGAPNVRVGMEDSLYAGKGKPATSSADQVKMAVNIAKELSLQPATPDDAREILDLKGLDQVNF